MKSFIFISIILLTGLSAFADINGFWQGTGQWSYDGNQTECNKVTFAFAETDSAFIRKNGHLECDAIVLEMPDLKLEKSGSELILNNKKIGKFSENDYSWVETFDENIKIHINIHRDGDHFDYTEQWLISETSLFYEITARVFIQN